MLFRRWASLTLAAALGAAASAAEATSTSAFAPVAPNTAIEFYHAEFDHYFLTQLAVEIDALDSGQTVGWTRTGRAFAIFAIPPPGGGDTFSPVCRFHIPPQHGDSHFFSASVVECTAILGKIGTDPNYSEYVEESPNVFYVGLPDPATGACPAGATVPVYRLWNQRADSNHRYTTDPGIKAAMIAKGYVAEGYGPDSVAMCSPAAVLVDALTRVSGLSTFAPGCDGVPAAGSVYINAEVEPSIAVNPANPDNFIGAWQQDRWSGGGSRGLVTAFTLDGGGTWTRALAPMSRCSGGTPANGGNFERASDPWVSIAPDGTAYQVALGFNNQANGQNAILVSRSTDGGRTWGNAISVRSDGAQVLNDKESITADPTDARYVYVVWDRLTGNHAPTWFARTTDGGATWEPARAIHDPGTNSQTINNQIVVLPDGTLIAAFTEIANVGPLDLRLRLLRSIDKGATWSAPITISDVQTLGTFDPETGTAIRDGSLLGSIAVGKNGMLVVAWQDSRFAAGGHDDIAIARSADGGLTWSAPLRINGNPDVPAFIPTVAIRDDGVIGVTYYDFRGNTPDPSTLWTSYWLATSSDGATWQERLIAGPFDYATALLVGGQLFLGDYMGLATVGTTFLPFFGQTTGDVSNRSDIFASLARASATAALTGETSSVKTATAVPRAMTADIAQRIDGHARGVVAARVQERRSAMPHP